MISKWGANLSGEQVKTSWARVLTLLSGGVAVSFLIGKVPASLALLRTDLDLSLFEAGLVVSIYSLLSGMAGIFFGVLSDQAGRRRIALIGMAIAALSSLAGAYVTTSEMLLVTRATEGLGFFLTVVSLPALMLRAASEADRQKALGLWSTYMPTGMAIMLFAGGYMADAIGWRHLWLVNAALITLIGVVIAVAVAPLKPLPRASAQPRPSLGMVGQALKPGPLLLALVFGSYASVFLIVTAFLPLILVEEGGWSIAAAGMAGAGVIAVNVIGCVASGWLLDAGYSRRGIILAVAGTMAVCAIVALAPLPVPVRLAAAAILTISGGLIPGVLFSGVPRHAPSPELVATVNGLMLQGVAFGQLVGPAAASWVVGQTGTWLSALIICLPLCALTALGGLVLGRLEQQHR